MKSKIYSFDFDGTLTNKDFKIDGLLLNDYYKKLVLTEDCIILTGRCFNESKYVINKLKELGIFEQPVFFNPLHLSIRGNHSEEARTKSAIHKVDVLTKLSVNHEVTHFEDDPIQIKLISGMLPYIELIKIININEVY